MLHPVIDHINGRRNRSVPLNDGRKISLVLFGGTMTGVRSAGAMFAVIEMGFAHAFDDIYTMSASFGNGCYFLSDQGSLGLSVYLDNVNGLSNRKFINFLRPWKLVDFDYLVYVVMKVKKPLNIAKIFAQKTNLWFCLHNESTKKNEYIEAHTIKEKDFFSIARAAMSISYLSLKGSASPTLVGTTKYSHPNIRGKEVITHVQHALDNGATDVLIISNTIEQKKIAEKYFPNSDKIFSISPEKFWKLSPLCIDKEALQKTSDQMGLKTKALFESLEKS